MQAWPRPRQRDTWIKGCLHDPKVCELLEFTQPRVAQGQGGPGARPKRARPRDLLTMARAAVSKPCIPVGWKGRMKVAGNPNQCPQALQKGFLIRALFIPPLEALSTNRGESRLQVLSLGSVGTDFTRTSSDPGSQTRSRQDLNHYPESRNPRTQIKSRPILPPTSANPTPPLLKVLSDLAKDRIAASKQARSMDSSFTELGGSMFGVLGVSGFRGGCQVEVEALECRRSGCRGLGFRASVEGDFTRLECRFSFGARESGPFVLLVRRSLGIRRSCFSLKVQHLVVSNRS